MNPMKNTEKLPEQLQYALDEYAKASQELQAFLQGLATKEDLKSLGGRYTDPYDNLAAIHDRLSESRDVLLEQLREVFFEEPREGLYNLLKDLQALHYLARLAQKDCDLYSEANTALGKSKKIYKVCGSAPEMKQCLQNTEHDKAQLFDTLQLAFYKAFLFYHFQEVLPPPTLEIPFHEMLEMVSLFAKPKKLDPV